MAREPVMVRQVCRLQPFPDAQTSALFATAEFIWRDQGQLELNFSVRSMASQDLSALIAVPETAAIKAGSTGRRLDNLWKHTCFEAFLGHPGDPSYWELNVAPGGDWNLYRFKSYRCGGTEEQFAQTPEVIYASSSGGLQCTIQLELAPWWPEAHHPDLALTMVLEEHDGGLSYWALCHPGNEPDFHDRRGFLRW